MRYYILAHTIHMDEWWVVAETADQAWATDEALTWHPSVVLSEEEADLDPDFQEPVRRWRERDDGALHADMAMGDACDVLETEAAAVRQQELTEKGFTLEEIASAIAEEVVRAPHPAAKRAREAPWFETKERLRAASYGLMWPLRDLAKINPSVARSAARNLARELRKLQDDEEFWRLLLSWPDDRDTLL